MLEIIWYDSSLRLKSVFIVSYLPKNYAIWRMDIKYILFCISRFSKYN